MSDDLYDIGDLGASRSTGKPFRKRWYVRLTLLIFVLGTTTIAAVVLGGYLLYDHITQTRAAGEAIAFTVPPGATGADIAVLLQREGLVEHEVFFRIAMKLAPSTTSIKHGDFLLPKGVSPVQLLEQLRTNTPLAPEIATIRVTIPEGLTIQQIADLQDDPEAFLHAVKSLDLFEQFGISAQSAEGFLMPNTYFFSQPPTEIALVERMADQFNRDYNALVEHYTDQHEFDRVTILTIASLIEEEARLDDERALVSAVVHNRLKRNMPLEMDSTLQYILGKYGQRLLNEDKKVDSPYNTYKRRGLPPGPISNPGAKSIEAAMNPADVDYIFFVSNADGMSHTFSTTLSEHNNAVAKYRREIRKQRREQQ